MFSNIIRKYENNEELLKIVRKPYALIATVIVTVAYNHDQDAPGYGLL